MQEMFIVVAPTLSVLHQRRGAQPWASAQPGTGHHRSEAWCPMATCNVRGAGSEGVRGEWGGARAPCMAIPFQAPNPRTRVAPDNASCVGQAPACRTRLLSWSPNDQARSSVVVLSNGSCCSYTQLPGSFRAAGGEGRTRGLGERVRKGRLSEEGTFLQGAMESGAERLQGASRLHHPSTSQAASPHHLRQPAQLSNFQGKY